VFRRHDPLGLVPDYRFFAPVPIQSTYHLLYRDRLEDGTVTLWTEVPMHRPRRWWYACCSPVRRRNKAFVDVVTELARIIHTIGPDAVPHSIAYLTLLRFVTALPHPVAARATQYGVMVSMLDARPPTEPDLLLASNFHDLHEDSSHGTQ
jgi:hypothetical protein